MGISKFYLQSNFGEHSLYGTSTARPSRSYVNVTLTITRLQPYEDVAMVEEDESHLHSLTHTCPHNW